MEWAARAGLTADLSAWTHADGDAYLGRAKARSFLPAVAPTTFCVTSVISGAPAQRRTFIQVGRGLQDPAAKSRLPVIPPETFWPLVRACWTYIDTFAPISPLLATKLRSRYAWTQNREVRPRIRDTTTRLTPGCHHPACSRTSTPWGARTGGRHINWDGSGLLHGTSIERHQLYGNRGPVGNFASIRRSAMRAPLIRLQLGPTCGC